MNSNYRRPNNPSQFAAAFRWVIVLTFVCIVGLSYVYLKNQMHQAGAKKHAMENELSELIRSNNIMAVQIADLTSTTNLQRRLDEGFIKLVPISAQAVVRVRPTEVASWTSESSRSLSEFHPISHNTGVRH